MTGAAADGAAVGLLRTTGAYGACLRAIAAEPRRWLVTGGAGFIGSHLVEALLTLEQRVVVFDDFSTGSEANLADVERRVGARAAGLEVVRGDVRDADAVARAASGAQSVLHLAAMVSVPASIDDPLTAHEVNVTGFLHVLEAARRHGARVVYAASSASYGDDPADVKREDRIGRPLSMYAATKSADEHYAAAYARAYGLATVGLRYFNVFGPRQDPNGAYAAVIPAWATTLLQGGRCHVHGDGSTTRDFCYVANVVGANLLAATTCSDSVMGASLNVGTGERTTLIELHDELVVVLKRLLPNRLDLAEVTPTFGPFRAGDVRHSCADVDAARSALGFEPVVGLGDGLVPTLSWFASNALPGGSSA